MSLLAGALCTLFSEGWLRGSMAVDIGWDEVGMCGQWPQKQGNACKNTEEEVVVGKRRKREKKRRVVSFNNGS
jgi:hypothetical protein